MLLPSYERVIKHPVVLVLSGVIVFLCWVLHAFFTSLDLSLTTGLLWVFGRNAVIDGLFYLLYWLSPAIFWMGFLAFFAFTNRRDHFIVFVGVIIFGGLLFGDLLKAFFALDRPPAGTREWLPALFKEMSPTETHDFPGQSSMMPAAVVTYFWLRDETPSRNKALLYSTFVIATILARPYLGMNYLSGTIAGAVMGIYMGLIAFETHRRKAEMSFLETPLNRLLAAFGLFCLLLVTYVIILERPWVYEGNLQTVDLDLRMFTMILGGLLGLALDKYPVQNPAVFRRNAGSMITLIILVVDYLVLGSLYIIAILTTSIHLLVGLVFAVVAGAWLTGGGPRLVDAAQRMQR